MAILKPFKGFRPLKDKVSQVASRPYDVLNSAEAKIEAEGNDYSFLHVVKPEIDLPSDIDHHAAEVYLKGKDNFEEMVRSGVMTQDEMPCLYIYELTMDGKSQTGIVGGAGIEDYFNNVIKKHELTRPDKELDRVNHVDVSNINAEPVFFAYPDVPKIDFIIERIVRDEPEYDFTTEDGIQHRFWVVSVEHTIQQIVDLFGEIPATYVADGHHRTAAAAIVGKQRKDGNPEHKGDEEYNFFMAVHFPASQLRIIDYNRVVKDLNDLSKQDVLAFLEQHFEIEDMGHKEFKPLCAQNFSMYLERTWYSLTMKAGFVDLEHPIDSLDVAILSKFILEPIFNIVDLRTDKRIDFVGGIRGLGELKNRVDSGEMAVAFALYPVSMDQLIKVADTDNIMPPKTTWFEPKLRSGLVVHELG